MNTFFCINLYQAKSAGRTHGGHARAGKEEGGGPLESAAVAVEEPIPEGSRL
jgi:hypothetical protein